MEAAVVACFKINRHLPEWMNRNHTEPRDRRLRVNIRSQDLLSNTKECLPLNRAVQYQHTLALDGGGFILGDELPASTEKARCSSEPVRTWRREKLVPAGNRTQIVQPVASFLTDSRHFLSKLPY